MRWFRRRRSVDVGTYEPPEPAEPAPVERIVEDGMLIADSVLLMTLRNQVIVDALRDRVDLNRDSLEAMANAELEALADNEWETAERLRMRREGIRVDDPWPEDSDEIDDRRQESQRREAVHRAMSQAFAARAADRGILSAMVERSRLQAWDEVSPVIIDRAVLIGNAVSHGPVRDEEYAAQRGERLGAFVAMDLTALAAERGVELF